MQISVSENQGESNRSPRSVRIRRALDCYMDSGCKCLVHFQIMGNHRFGTRITPSINHGTYGLGVVYHLLRFVVITMTTANNSRAPYFS